MNMRGRMSDMENFVADIASAEKVPRTKGSLPSEVVVLRFPGLWTTMHAQCCRVGFGVCCLWVGWGLACGSVCETGGCAFVCVVQ